jgi:hypothetical protein
MGPRNPNPLAPDPSEGRVAQTLVGYRLRDRQRILDLMGEFAEQRCQTGLGNRTAQAVNSGL